MPSQVVTAHTTAKVVAAEIKNARYKVTSLTIDNKAGSTLVPPATQADRTIKVVDSFTTDKGHTNAATVETITRYQTTVLQGDIVTLNEEDLKGVRCIGALTILADAIDAGCSISVGYELD